jgi:hypothetical protein
MTEQQILDLKKKIDSQKQKQSELKGKRKGLLETLKNTFDCDSVEEAERKAADIQKRIEKLEAEKQKGIKEIEDNYEF